MADIPIISGDVFRATATFLVENVDVTQWVWHWVADNDALLDTAVLGTAAAAQMNSAWAVIEADMSAEIAGSILDIALYNVGLDTWNTIVQADITTLFGTNNSAYMPLGANLLVKLFSERAKALGKKFMMGFTEGDQGDGQWSAAVLINAALWASGQFTALIAGLNILIPCVFNQETQDVNILTGTFQSESNVAYQRRRKPGVGL